MHTMESKATVALREAHEKWYRVTEDWRMVSYTWKELSPYKDRWGYYKFSYWKIRLWVHRLQAYQKFWEDLFEEWIVARHLDWNSINNSRDNIAIGSQSDNMFDVPRHKRVQHANIASSYWKKHDHNKIYNMSLSWMSYVAIMEETGIKSKGTISYIINRQRDICESSM